MTLENQNVQKIRSVDVIEGKQVVLNVQKSQEIDGILSAKRDDSMSCQLLRTLNEYQLALTR